MNQKKMIRLTAWIVGVMIILACSAVTQATPTSTPLPPTATSTTVPPTTVPPTSTATPVPPTSEPEILYQDDFSSNTRGWETGAESTDIGSSEIDIVDGQYVVNLSATGEYFGSVIFFPDFSGKDFIMSMDVTILEEVPANLMLSFDVRGNNSKYYSFSFFNGESQLTLTQDKKDDVKLWDWMKSSAIKLDKGVKNTFKFEVNGSTFTLYVNDEKINSATDDVINEPGEVDIIVMLTDANETLSIAFDNLVIQSIK